MLYSPEIEQAMRSSYDSLSEKDRRRYAAIEVAKLGHGGVEYGVLSILVDGGLSGGGLLLPHAVHEDGALDDLGQERRTVQRSPLL